MLLSHALFLGRKYTRFFRNLKEFKVKCQFSFHRHLFWLETVIYQILFSCLILKINFKKKNNHKKKQKTTMLVVWNHHCHPFLSATWPAEPRPAWDRSKRACSVAGLHQTRDSALWDTDPSVARKNGCLHTFFSCSISLQLQLRSSKTGKLPSSVSTLLQKEVFWC